jgi:hypothetical protein
MGAVSSGVIEENAGLHRTSVIFDDTTSLDLIRTLDSNLSFLVYS